MAYRFRRVVTIQGSPEFVDALEALARQRGYRSRQRYILGLIAEDARRARQSLPPRLSWKKEDLATLPGPASGGPEGTAGS